MSSEAKASFENTEKLKKPKHSKRKHRETVSSDESEKRKKRKLKREKKKHKKEKKKSKLKPKPEEHISDTEEANLDIPLTLMDRSRAMAPMTKEQWEKEQSVVKRVYDETTGRSRLIKGSGEVIEEIVSRDRHKEINKQATKGDGDFFQATVTSKKFEL